MRKINTDLMQAAKDGDVARLQDLIAKGADVNTRDDSMITALHWAAWYGQAPVCATLIACGSDVDAMDDDGWRALHSASQRGSALICAALAAAGADLNAKNGEGLTALHKGALGGRAEACAALIRAGADAGDFVELCTQGGYLEVLAAGQAVIRELAMAEAIEGSTNQVAEAPTPGRRMRAV